MKSVNPTILQELENTFFPAVFALVNPATKTAWISRTNCLAEGIFRTIKGIKSGDHPIKDLVGFELVCLYSGEKVLYEYSRICQEYKEIGWTLLNRSIKYYLKKRLRKQDNGKYVAIVVLGTRNYDLKVLGEFPTMLECDEFIRQWYETN